MQEPNAGLDLRTAGSCPEPKAVAAEPARHPKRPDFVYLCQSVIGKEVPLGERAHSLLGGSFPVAEKEKETAAKYSAHGR